MFAGKVKAIGVSNLSKRLLETELLPYATVVPAVNQVRHMNGRLFIETD